MDVPSKRGDRAARSPLRRRVSSYLLPAAPPPIATGIAVAALLITLETLVPVVVGHPSEEAERAALYLVGVVVTASVWGAALGIATGVVSTIAFNVFHVAPVGQLHLTPERDLVQATISAVAALLVSGLARLARTRVAEADRRRTEADFAAELTRLTLSHDDPGTGLRAASQRLAYQFGLRYAAIDLAGSGPGPPEGATVFGLYNGQVPIGTLSVPADTPAATLQRIEYRLVPSLQAAIRAARDRQDMVASLRRSQRETAALLDEQAALRRVATLVARGSAPDEVFAAVTMELHRLHNGLRTALLRFEPDGTVTRLAGCDEHGHTVTPGDNWPVTGVNVSGAVRRTGRSARVDNYDATSGPIARDLVGQGIHSGVGVPVVVEGALWGVTLLTSSRSLRPTIPADAEARLRGFTELVATAVANAENRAQLIASRARLVTAADEARRRIERELHDGVQQRVMSLALNLRLSEGSVAPDQPAFRHLLSSTVQALNEIHDDMRELARDIHPQLLSQRGIVPVLKTLGRRCSVPVELDLHIEQERLHERTAVAAYNVASEALTNVAKHAKASVVSVVAETDASTIRLAIRDDGVGGADPGRGGGLTSLRDRVEALGGRMTIVSPPGRGTTLTVTLPLAATQPADPDHTDDPSAGRDAAPADPHGTAAPSNRGTPPAATRPADPPGADRPPPLRHPPAGPDGADHAAPLEP
ncbi:DUF4118 domain-containing protein [Dactylosporangium sp. CA-092794]|uniref:sensor histidine kinase n=1 Tax=Dactylosporangium sp. CA-092794 TaxID=3239929 RepID=UPI003D8C3AF0